MAEELDMSLRAYQKLKAGKTCADFIPYGDFGFMYVRIEKHFFLVYFIFWIQRLKSQHKIYLAMLDSSILFGATISFKYRVLHDLNFKCG